MREREVKSGFLIAPHFVRNCNFFNSFEIKYRFSIASLFSPLSSSAAILDMRVEKRNYTFEYNRLKIFATMGCHSSPYCSRQLSSSK